jgi:hypothetical protein
MSTGIDAPIDAPISSGGSGVRNLLGAGWLGLASCDFLAYDPEIGEPPVRPTLGY